MTLAVGYIVDRYSYAPASVFVDTAPACSDGRGVVSDRQAGSELERRNSLGRRLDLLGLRTGCLACTQRPTARWYRTESSPAVSPSMTGRGASSYPA